jgi:hypothetical protein
MFSYYHSDANAILQSPLSHVVIDDGRRYLERSREQFDVITIDPPPPLEAAASSLLYSEEFYRVARRRLRPGGILQQWLPTTTDDDPQVVAAVTRSLKNSFPYVRAFSDQFGLHFLCSDHPTPSRPAEDLTMRLPPSAQADFAEWARPQDAGAKALVYREFATLLQQESPIDPLIAASPETPALTDDRPINEYYAFRKWRMGKSPFANQDSE